MNSRMSRAFILFAALTAAFISAPQGFAADNDPTWTKLSTPNFELYTTAGEGTGRRAIKHFETIRSFFQQSMPGNRGQDAKVRVILFKNEKEYKPFSPNEVAAAYYLSGHDFDYIVMNGFNEHAKPIAAHEYMHLLTSHQKYNLPIWLNEGYATLFESLEGYAGKVRVGKPHLGRLQHLDRKKWLEIERLTEVEHDSPEYNTKDHAGVFYAQSWALTHMLNLDKDYRTKLNDFLLRMAESKSAAQAFADVYGKTPDDIRQDLKSYVSNDRFFVVLFDVKLEKYADQPEIAPADELETRMLLATLYSRLKDKRDEAKESYEQLTLDFPESPEPHEALAYLAWREDGADAAAPYFAGAIERKSTNAKIYYDFASLRRGEADDPAKRILYLLKATRLRENYVDAHRALAFEASNQERWGVAAVHFGKLGKVKEEDAYSILSSSAYAFYKLKQWETALKHAQDAKRWAKTPSETDRAFNLIEAIQWEANPDKRAEMAQRRAEEMRALRSATPDDIAPVLRRAEQPAKGVHRLQRNATPFVSTVEGELIQFDCLDVKARIHVRTPTETVMLAIPDPTNILLIDDGARSGQLFTCGEQQPRPVSVKYDPVPDVHLETVGNVTQLEFMTLGEN